MFARELFCGVVADESLVEEPFDRSALGSNITQGVPRRPVKPPSTAQACGNVKTLRPDRQLFWSSAGYSIDSEDPDRNDTRSVMEVTM